MAATATRRIALFSIKPRYADAILKGVKTVEFRRTPLAPDVSHVVIYATTPVKRVIGAFEVAGVDQASPAALWNSYAAVGGIGRADYVAYFNGVENGYAIRVRRPRRWPEPLALHDLSPGLRAPQSYQYLRDDALARVWPMLDEQRVALLDRLRMVVAGMVAAVLPGLTKTSRPEGEPALPSVSPSPR